MKQLIMNYRSSHHMCPQVATAPHSKLKEHMADGLILMTLK